MDAIDDDGYDDKTRDRKSRKVFMLPDNYDDGYDDNTSDRKRRKVLVLPDNRTFTIDEADYLVFNEMLSRSGVRSLDDIQKLTSNMISEGERAKDRAKRVFRLDINRETIKSIPHDFGELEFLTHLTFSGAKFKILPPSIGKLKNLQRLSLLRNYDLSELPYEIGDLANLIELSLMSVRIASIPSSIGRLQNLEDLKILCCDHLTNVPEEIGDLSSLTSLWIIQSIISTLPSSIGQLHCLKSLVLASTQLSTLPREIGNLSNLQDVNFGKTPIKSLPDSFARLTRLSHLGLCKTAIPELRCKDSVAFLLKLVRQHPSLCRLDVQQTKLDEDEMKRIFYALAFNKARSQTESMRSSHEVGEQMELLPLIIHRAARAFRGSRIIDSSFLRDSDTDPIQTPDAVFYFLEELREHFLRLLIHRSKIMRKS